MTEKSNLFFLYSIYIYISLSLSLDIHFLYASQQKFD